MSTLEESAERLPEDKDLAPDRTRRKPPPGPPVYVQDLGTPLALRKSVGRLARSGSANMATTTRRRAKPDKQRP